jgi:hypothetical protein
MMEFVKEGETSPMVGKAAVDENSPPGASDHVKPPRSERQVVIFHFQFLPRSFFSLYKYGKLVEAGPFFAFPQSPFRKKLGRRGEIEFVCLARLLSAPCFLQAFF